MSQQPPRAAEDDSLNDAWLQSEMHDLFLSRETGTTLSQAALDEAIATLKEGEPLSLPQAFDLLHQAQLGDMRIFGQMPVRATASPFIPSLGSAYIVSRRLSRDDQGAGSLDAQQQQEAISVTFQSVLNSEVWWSRDVLGFGVAARPMGRSIRTWKKARDKEGRGGEAGIERESHGYRGRLYTLVAKKTEIPSRPEGEEPEPGRLLGYPADRENQPSPAPAQSSPPPSPTRSASPTRGSKRPRGSAGAQLGVNERCIAVGDIGIVQVWRPKSGLEVTPRGKAPAPTSPVSPAPADLGGFFPPPPGAPSPGFGGAFLRPASPPDEPQRLLPDTASTASLGIPSYETNDVVLNGSLRVRGDIYAEGRIIGTFVTPPRAADYAEFFFWDSRYLGSQRKCPGKVAPARSDRDDGPPPPGSVVQLRSPEQTLTLDTTGDGPCLVVSTQPSVAAGVPLDPVEADKGALVAFVGQVPVRCRGPVSTGDALVPSGDCDGCAVAAPPDAAQPVGYGMHAAVDDDERDRDDDDETTVLCLVRWDMAVTRKVTDAVDLALGNLQLRIARSSALVGLVAAALWFAAKTASLALPSSTSSSDKRTTVAKDLLQTLAFFAAILALAVLGLTLLVLRHPAVLDAAPGLAATWTAYLLLAFIHQVLKDVDEFHNDALTAAFAAANTVAAAAHHALLAHAFLKVRASTTALPRLSKAS